MKTALTLFIITLSTMLSAQTVNIAFSDQQEYQVINETENRQLFFGNLSSTGFFTLSANKDKYSGVMTIATPNNRYFIRIAEGAESLYLCREIGSTLIWQFNGQTFTQYAYDDVFEL